MQVGAFSLLSVAKLNLLYSNCVYGLTHAAEVKSIPNSEMHNSKCYIALYYAKRCIFSYNKWESMRQLRPQLSFPNVTEIFHSKCLNGETQNEVIRRLAVYTVLENVEN